MQTWVNEMQRETGCGGEAEGEECDVQAYLTWGPERIAEKGTGRATKLEGVVERPQ